MFLLCFPDALQDTSRHVDGTFRSLLALDEVYGVWEGAGRVGAAVAAVEAMGRGWDASLMSKNGNFRASCFERKNDGENAIAGDAAPILLKVQGEWG